jgi:hypothetical protein
MSHIQYGDRKIFFQIKRSNRRKTVGIHLDLQGGVVVYCPQSLELSRIREIVRKRARWIIEKQEIVKNQGHLVPAKEFVSGESFPYLGRQYRLKVVKAAMEKEVKCRLSNGRFLVEVNGHLNGKRLKRAVKSALMNWYSRRAEDKIPERVGLYARQLGKWPERIEIKRHKRRWGSCSHQGIVRFNWKIIMAPLTIVDYVIVHELCHLVYPDHSDKFWQKVQTILHDYAKRRIQLREYTPQMGGFD